MQTDDVLLQSLLGGVRRRVRSGGENVRCSPMERRRIQAMSDANGRGDVPNTDSSPLLQSSLSPPMLTVMNELSCTSYSSTSSDTLSEQGASDSDEIEELLSVACPGEASFASDSEHSPTTPTPRCSYKYQPCPIAADDVIVYVRHPHGRGVVPVTESGFRVERMSNSTRDNIDGHAARPLSNEFVWPRPGAEMAAPAANCVLYNSSSPSHGNRSPNRRHLSLQPNRGGRSPRMTQRQTSLRVPDHVNSGDNIVDVTTGTYIALKPKDKNERGLDGVKHEENVIRFKKYLKTKGIKLDMNSVQTSNV